MARDYADLLGLAAALVSKRRCPMCEAKSWKAPTKPMLLAVEGEKQPVHTVHVTCGDCGYLVQFVCAYLERYARRLNSENN
jgi:hypothetical protein